MMGAQVEIAIARTINTNTRTFAQVEIAIPRTINTNTRTFAQVEIAIPHDLEAQRFWLKFFSTVIMDPSCLFVPLFCFVGLFGW